MKKVIVPEIKGIGNGQMKLTCNKEYIVVDENEKMVKIYNDNNEPQWYFKARFEGG